MKLPAFIKAHQADLSSEYYHLTIGQKEDFRKSVMNLRQSRVKIVRANPKALQKDINATFNIMQNEVTRTGFEGMYLAVRGDIEQYHEPKLFYTSKVASFIKDILGMEPKRFALKLESWVKRVIMNYENYERKIVETYSIAL
ncbi:uncharacterized protein F5147DRAFT_560080, partial [Suillus discolor]